MVRLIFIGWYLFYFHYVGQYWCHVEPPQVGCPIRQISAGRTKVLAVDDNKKLWARQEIVEIFKEGTHWKHISDDVKQVSVGPKDQVCVLIYYYCH